jgi:hypothetical protein
MKLVYILIALVVAASTLGCIGNKQGEPSTSAPAVPVETSVSPVATTAPASDDPFGTDMDVAALDSMLADSSMDISLTDSI